MGKNKLIKGPAGSQTREILIDTYQRLLEQGVRSDTILVLLRNRRQSIIWRKMISISKMSSIRIQSYFGFIQSEIKKYWPLLSLSIEGFKKGTIEPAFLTSEVSQFIINRFVEEFRKEGRFMDTPATSEKISIEILSVISRAVTSNFDYCYAGKRLFDASLKKDAVRERLFLDLQELINKYVDYCKQNGYIDYFLGVEIYNNNLLKSDEYKKRLKKDIRYLIVDGLEEAVPCETDFISILMEITSQSWLSFCSDGAVSRKQGACPEYVERMIFTKCEISEIKDRGINSEIESIQVQAELRSEMISKVCLEIENQIEKGAKSCDIAVVCPIVDSVLEYCLESWFAKKEIKVVNIARNRSYMEDSFIRALVTLSCLSHPMWNINPPGHDIANLLSMVLGLDPVRSALLAREVMSQKPFTLPEIESLEFRDRIGFLNTEKYYYLKNWIEEYRGQKPEDIQVFFQKALRTILLRLPKIEEHINSCRILIESAETFTNIIGKMLDTETGKAFIEMIIKGVKPAETILELEQKIYSKDILLSTPIAYISSSIRRKIQIWVDTSSILWFKSDVDQISNPYIFSPEWKEGSLWTEEQDEKYRILKYETIKSRLKKNCGEKIIFAESQYNQDGYENG